MKCPGSDRRDITASLHPCPDCGEMVELFSDEMHARCRKCGADVQRDAVPPCVQWCSAAKQCLGEKRWKKVMESLGKNPDENRD